ncbi:hypothetical protein HY029_00095 [Candidatus Gottesmanbacteria bacterium]|nr:hypothetical protein [Candidatus Gottesmanbacteria bacterium]
MTHNSNNFEECLNNGPSQQKKSAPPPATRQKSSQSSQPRSQLAPVQESSIYKTTQAEDAYQAFISCLDKKIDFITCTNDPAYKKIEDDARIAYDNCLDGCGPNIPCRTKCNSFKSTLDEILSTRGDALLEDAFEKNIRMPTAKPSLPQDFIREFESMAGGLSRPFDDIYWRSRQISAYSTTDNTGKPVVRDEVFKNGWNNAPPIIKEKIPLENLKKDEFISTEMPPGSPLGKMIFATADPVKYATTEITIYDGKTTPEILRQTTGGLSNDDVMVPDPKKYDLSFYFKVGTVVTENDEEIHPFSGALFEILPWLTFNSPQYIRNLRVIRWNRSQDRWDDLPITTEKSCDYTKGCRVFAKSPGTSYFAVVANKQIPWLELIKKTLFFLLQLVFLVGEIFIVIWIVRKIKKHLSKKKHTVRSRKKQKR